MTDAADFPVPLAHDYEPPARALDESKLAEPFTRVHAVNVKGEGFDHPLGRNTAIVGYNRAGKTAVLDALRAVLLGVHPDVNHPKSGKQWLDALAPKGAKSLSVTLEHPGGDAKFSVKKSGSKTTAPSRYLGVLESLPEEARAHILPLASKEFTALFEAGADLGNRFFLQRFGADVLDEALTPPRGSTERQKGCWNELLAEARENLGEDASPLGLLTEIAKLADARKKNANKEVKRLQTALNDSEGAATAGAEMLPQLREELKRTQHLESLGPSRTRLMELTTQIRQLEQAPAQNAAAPGAATQDQLVAAEAEADERYRAAQARHVEAKEAADALCERNRDLASMVNVVRRQAELDNQCVLCRSPVDNRALLGVLENLLRERAPQLEQLYRQADAAKQEVSARWRQAQEAQQTRIKQAKAQAECEALDASRAARLEAMHEEKAALKQQLEQAAIGVARTVKEVQAEITALERAQEAKRRAAEEENALAQREEDAELAKAVEKKAKNKLSNLNKKVRDRALGVVNRYLAGDLEAHFEDGLWRVSGRDGEYHRRSASGRERCAIRIALAQAWTEDAPFRMNILDDDDLRGFDADYMSAVMQNLKALADEGLFNQNVVVVPPAFTDHPRLAEIVEGWDVIHVRESP